MIPAYLPDEKGVEDNHFLSKLWQMPEDDYGHYYQYHLNYFLSWEPQGEQEFFSFVWRIVLVRINFLGKRRSVFF